MSDRPTVRVELRGNVIARAAALVEDAEAAGVAGAMAAGAGIFLALDPVPPVGSRLTVFREAATEDAGEGQIFEVRRSVTHGDERGCLGTWVEESDAKKTVGSEHFAPQNISSSMAVAAPVAVTDEPTGVVEMLSGRPPKPPADPEPSKD